MTAKTSGFRAPSGMVSMGARAVEVTSAASCSDAEAGEWAGLLRTVARRPGEQDLMTVSACFSKPSWEAAAPDKVQAQTQQTRQRGHDA